MKGVFNMLAIKYVPGAHITHVTKLGVESLAGKISERLLAYAYENWTQMIDEDGDISVDEDGMVSRELEHITESYPEGLFERVFNHPAVGSALDEVKTIVRDLADDAREWHEASQSSYAMLRYHGHTWRDFA